MVLPLESMVEVPKPGPSGPRPYCRLGLTVFEQRSVGQGGVALARVQHGNLSNAKGVWGCVLLVPPIDFGPGYRFTFGKDADRLVILVGGERKTAT